MTDLESSEHLRRHDRLGHWRSCNLKGALWVGGGIFHVEPTGAIAFAFILYLAPSLASVLVKPTKPILAEL